MIKIQLKVTCPLCPLYPRETRRRRRPRPTRLIQLPVPSESVLSSCTRFRATASGRELLRRSPCLMEVSDSEDEAKTWQQITVCGNCNNALECSSMCSPMAAASNSFFTLAACFSRCSPQSSCTNAKIRMLTGKVYYSTPSKWEPQRRNTTTIK